MGAPFAKRICVQRVHSHIVRALCPESAMPDDPQQASESTEAAAARDVALMLRVGQGDEGAFRELVEIHQYRVVGTVARMLGDESDAEDVAQQVFVRVWKSASRYEPTAKFTTWLFTIARNLVFNELRRKKRHVIVSLDAPMEPGEERVRDQPDTRTKWPDTALLDEEMMDAIQKAIEELPEQQRMAIVLRRYEDSPYEEIAEVLDITVPAVKSLLFRARTELREKLARYLGE
jgi:RNA polymerase sigma-70 factor, ECF subfamily